MGRKKTDPHATPVVKRRVKGKSADALPEVPWVPPPQSEAEQGKIFWDKYKRTAATPGVIWSYVCYFKFCFLVSMKQLAIFILLVSFPPYVMNQ